MPDVYNWQIGREMTYPYEGTRPQRQFGAVFNINRCIGCQTCTMACKSTWTFNKGQEHMWWNNVETKPYGGYPQHWDVKLLSRAGEQAWANGVYKGRTLVEAAPEGEVALGYLPEDKEWRAPNFYEDTATPWGPGATLPVHQTFFFYLQRICNHCTYPTCLSACPRRAIYKRPEDGIVLIDQERCRGYRKCVEQCPYKRPMYNGATRISEKCIACYPRVEQGYVTRCIAACVGKIRLQGWIKPPEEAVPDSPIDYLVHITKVARPLYPQFGLEANIYYIPPRWAPRAYLTQMFGPGVDEAIAKYTNPDHELLGLLQLFGTTQRIIERFRVTDTDAVGYDGNGHELVRVPIEEPVIVRAPERHNIT
jgi:nitrate reductase beta subunit